MNEFEYQKLRLGGYKEFFSKFDGLSFDEYLSKIVPAKIFQEGFFELNITKLERKNFGVVKPTYKLFYSKTKNGAFLKAENICDVCCSEPNLYTLVSGILNNHGILGLVMSTGIQRNNDLFQKDSKF